MIFHTLKLIFIHVERTGGVALRKLLLKYENDFQRLAKTKHLTSTKIKELINNDFIWNNYLKIGFVRNPWDRMVSWYFACKQNKTWTSSLAKHFQKAYNFEEVIKNPHPKMLIPQIEKVSGVDLIYKYENYNKNVKEITSLLEIPYEKIIDNSSNHKHYRNYYTKETKTIVGNWYEKDIEMFKYSF